MSLPPFQPPPYRLSGTGTGSKLLSGVSTRVFDSFGLESNYPDFSTSQTTNMTAARHVGCARVEPNRRMTALTSVTQHTVPKAGRRGRIALRECCEPPPQIRKLMTRSYYSMKHTPFGRTSSAHFHPSLTIPWLGPVQLGYNSPGLSRPILEFITSPDR